MFRRNKREIQFIKIKNKIEYYYYFLINNKMMELCNDIKYEILCKLDEYNLIKLAYVSDNDTQELILYRIKKSNKKIKICNISASKGDLLLLKYAHESGCPWDEYTCQHAAKNGHLECLKYLHENGCPWDAFTCEIAVINGNLECLKYVHENGGPWGRYTCETAASNGHIECLKYAHDFGCPWSLVLYETAAKRKYNL
jgi:hypothetical protein